MAVVTTPPTAQGTLAKTPLLHLVVYMADQGLSGSVVFQHGTIEHVVSFRGGSPAKVRTGEPVAQLGRVLFDLGLIDETTLNDSLRDLSAGKMLHGQLLLQRGAIDEGTLVTALRAQVIEKMSYLFGLPPETVYAFYQDVNLLEDWGGPEMTPVDPLGLVSVGVRANANHPMVEATLARLGATPLRLHEASDVTRFALMPDEMRVIELLRAKPLSLNEITSSGEASIATVRLIVYALFITRHLDHGPSAARPVGIDFVTESERARQIASGRHGGVAVARVKLTTRRQGDDGTAGPNLAPQKRAVSSHPPRAPSIHPPPIQPPAPQGPPSPKPSPVAAGSTTLRSEPSAALSEAMEARRLQIEERAKSIDREDYFTMLGVKRDADERTVESAYFALAKVWHSDRLPPELAPARDAAAKVFARMSEAFEMLSDPLRRKRYVEVMKGGGGTPEEAEKIQQIVDAATDFQRGEIYLKKRDLVNAEACATRAFKADPDQADYVALHATLQAMKRSSEQPVDDLIKLLDVALKKNDASERAYYCRATLLKRAGRLDVALSDFRSAVELNPKNLDAQRELRLYDMRRSKHPSKYPGRKPTPSKPPTKPPSRPPSKPPTGKKEGEGGVLSGLGKLFKR